MLCYGYAKVCNAMLCYGFANYISAMQNCPTQLGPKIFKTAFLKISHF
jgi:hypothetical protein